MIKDSGMNDERQEFYILSKSHMTLEIPIEESPFVTEDKEFFVSFQYLYFFSFLFLSLSHM